MNHIETVTETKKIIWASREFKVVTAFDKPTIERFRKAAIAYRLYCQMEPKADRCELAIKLGAKYFSDQITDAPVSIGKMVAILRSDERSGKLANVRQQLMAFSRVVSITAMEETVPSIAALWAGGKVSPSAIAARLRADGMPTRTQQVARHLPNSVENIGGSFGRDHSTVVYAVKKYGKAISEALECKS